MKLNFNLEDIKYLKISYFKGDKEEVIKLALKEKRENEFIAIGPAMDTLAIRTPQKISIGFVCHDGLYTTSANLKEVSAQDGYTYFVIKNPETLDYQQNREYYRILVDYDCIYTVYSDDGTESYSATTYDLSAGGVSIIMEENAISRDECSIVIMIPGGDLKSHLKFMRCDVHEDNYKLSFEFTDLSERDYQRLNELCVNEQQKNI